MTYWFLQYPIDQMQVKVLHWMSEGMYTKYTETQKERHTEKVWGHRHDQRTVFGGGGVGETHHRQQCAEIDLYDQQN